MMPQAQEVWRGRVFRWGRLRGILIASLWLQALPSQLPGKPGVSLGRAGPRSGGHRQHPPPASGQPGSSRPQRPGCLPPPLSHLPLQEQTRARTTAPHPLLQAGGGGRRWKRKRGPLGQPRPHSLLSPKANFPLQRQASASQRNRSPPGTPAKPCSLSGPCQGIAQAPRPHQPHASSPLPPATRPHASPHTHPSFSPLPPSPGSGCRSNGRTRPRGAGSRAQSRALLAGSES